MEVAVDLSFKSLGRNSHSRSSAKNAQSLINPENMPCSFLEAKNRISIYMPCMLTHHGKSGQ